MLYILRWTGSEDCLRLHYINIIVTPFGSDVSHSNWIIVSHNLKKNLTLTANFHLGFSKVKLRMWKDRAQLKTWYPQKYVTTVTLELSLTIKYYAKRTTAPAVQSFKKWMFQQYLTVHLILNKKISDLRKNQFIWLSKDCKWFLVVMHPN